MLKKILLLFSCLTLSMSLYACGEKENVDDGISDTQKQEDQIITETDNTQNNSELYADAVGFTIELENGGVMKGELYPNLAPVTVKNFIKLAKDNFYDGLIFHRVIKGFMIQGGGYDTNMIPRETESIKGEFAANGFENELKHTKGVISMARTEVPDSASSQFFIMHEDAPHLDGNYAAFGRIIEGFDIIDEIATAETGVYAEYGIPNVPVEQIVIKTIDIE